MFVPPPPPPSTSCTLEDGIELCKILHEELHSKGYFPALTGGLLYKEGKRKDIDIVLYRHRQDVTDFETIDLLNALSKVGVQITGSNGFITKATWKGKIVDLFNPETKQEFKGY